MKTHGTKADALLRIAADTIGQRATSRDMPGGERSMARAVSAFNNLVGGDARLTVLDGWLFMCCLKMARATAGQINIDDYVDLAGYAALAAECCDTPCQTDGVAPESGRDIPSTDPRQPAGSCFAHDVGNDDRSSQT